MVIGNTKSDAENRIRSLRSVALIAGFSVVFLGACSRQQIGDFTGADITKGASNVLSSIMGRSTSIEGPGDDDGRLDARSPLVLPPDLTLQPPADKERDTALLTSQWPDDPDERVRREAEEAAQLEAERSARIERNIAGTVSGSEPLSREELLAGAVERDPNYSSAEEVQARQLASRALSPEELLNRRSSTSNRVPSNEAPGPPIKDAATQGIATAPTPPPATGRELVVPPNMQDAPPGGLGPEEDRPGVLKRMQFWRRDS